jgi:UDP-glucose 4-epimerase
LVTGGAGYIGSRTAVERITGKTLEFHEFDLRDEAKLASVFAQNDIGASLSLLNAMQNAGVKKPIFSSSATVYGDPD